MYKVYFYYLYYTANIFIKGYKFRSLVKFAIVVNLVS